MLQKVAKTYKVVGDTLAPSFRPRAAGLGEGVKSGLTLRVSETEDLSLDGGASGCD